MLVLYSLVFSQIRDTDLLATPIYNYTYFADYIASQKFHHLGLTKVTKVKEKVIALQELIDL